MIQFKCNNKEFFVKHALKGVLKCIEVESYTPPPLPQIVTKITMELSQTVTGIASNMQLIVYCYKVLQEKLISVWANWKAVGWC